MLREHIPKVRRAGLICGIFNNEAPVWSFCCVLEVFRPRGWNRPSVRISAGGETSAISIWLHHLCCRNKNTGPDFTGWNKNSSKWVKYEKVTVFSSPLLSLSGYPLPSLGPNEDWWELRRTCWSELTERKDKGKQDGTIQVLKTGLAAVRFRCPRVEDLTNSQEQPRLRGGQEVNKSVVAFRFTSEPQHQGVIRSVSVCDTDDAEAWTPAKPDKKHRSWTNKFS